MTDMKTKIAIVIASLVLVACQTQRIATDIDQHVQSHDSVRIQVVNVYDTTHVIDTVRIEVFEQSVSTEHTDVQFGVGGGTYNTKTGEATNVVGVTSSAEMNELKRANAMLTHELENTKSSNDSLNATISDLKNDLVQNESVVRTRSGWDSFTTWWFIATALFILIRVAWWAFKTFYLHR